MPNAEVVVTDGRGKAEKQSADVDDLIATRVDVLLLTPLTADALTPAAQAGDGRRHPGDHAGPRGRRRRSPSTSAPTTS